MQVMTTETSGEAYGDGWGTQGERCRNSQHHHSTTENVPIHGGGLLEWEARRFQYVTETLTDMGVAIVPDIVANAGGVISSYFEWVQNHERMSWAEHKERASVLDRLDATWRLLAQTPIGEWRNRALTIAIGRVLEGMTARGMLTHGKVRAT